MDWRTSTLNTSSWWEIPARDRSSGHSNSFHGNFVPQIPNEYIKRFTKKGDWVYDPFLGSGTTAIECVHLKRNCVGVELNKTTFESTSDLLDNILEASGSLAEMDFYRGDSTKMTPEKIGHELALTIMHPPYLDIIRFNEGDKRCLGPGRKP